VIGLVLTITYFTEKQGTVLRWDSAVFKKLPGYQLLVHYAFKTIQKCIVQ